MSKQLEDDFSYLESVMEGQPDIIYNKDTQGDLTSYTIPMEVLNLLLSEIYNEGYNDCWDRLKGELHD